RRREPRSSLKGVLPERGSPGCAAHVSTCGQVSRLRSVRSIGKATEIVARDGARVIRAAEPMQRDELAAERLRGERPALRELAVVPLDGLVRRAAVIGQAPQEERGARGGPRSRKA